MTFEAFNSFVRCIFEPYFVMAVIALLLIAGRRLTGYPVSWKWKGVALFFTAGFLWRFFYGIESKRYAVGMVPLAILLLLYLVAEEDWKWARSYGKYFRLFFSAALVVCFLIVVGKDFRSNSKSRDISATCVRLQEFSAPYSSPGFYHLNAEGHRLGWYLKRPVVDLPSGKRPEMIRELRNAGYAHDALFLLVGSGSKAEKALETSAHEANPLNGLERIYAAPAGETSIYRWHIRDPLAVWTYLPGEAPAAEGAVLWKEDFESSERVRVADRPFAELSVRGMDWNADEEGGFLFPRALRPNPGAGFVAPRIAGSTITVTEPGSSATLFGERSLEVMLNSGGGLFFSPQLSVEGECAVELFYSGSPGTQIWLKHYSPVAGPAVEIGRFTCRTDGEIRRARWTIPAGSIVQISSFQLGISPGKIIIDELKIFAEGN